MNKAPRAFWIGILFCVLLSLYFLFQVPTFDLDESLYRRVAEEMKLRSDWWNPTWDARPLLHKPPVLYWLIELFSNLIDGANALVSSTAARMPGLFVAIAMSVALGWTRSLYLWLGAFPLITVCSVIFDPLQTLALLPAILIPHRWFREDRDGSNREYLFVGLSLAAATAIKGLNGIVIPSLAILIQTSLRNSAAGTRGMLAGSFRFVLRSLVPAVALSALWYLLLDQKMGRAFTEEFFWVQHFGRSQTPMESHGGGVLYYPLVLILGCGALLPFLIAAIQGLRDPAVGPFRVAYAREGYPLTFALCFVLIFTFSATKLPHYLWPVWPALAVFVASHPRASLGRAALALSWIPMLVLTLAALAIAINPVPLVHALTNSPALESMLPYGSSLPFPTRLGAAAAAALGAVMLIRRARFVQRPDITFAASSLFFLLLVGSVTPYLVDRVQKPITAIADEVNAIHPAAGTCMWYSGPHSPSLSLALGHSVHHNRCEPQDMQFLIAPDWKIAECAERGMILVAHQGYLNLCEKDAGRVGAVSGKPAIPVESVIARASGAAEAPAEGVPPSSLTPGADSPLAGADGVAGTEDDLSIAQTPGADGVMGTEDDVVVTRYVGPDKTAGTEDDIPAAAAASGSAAIGIAPRAQARAAGKSRITHLGTESGDQVQVMNFTGADEVEGTADDVAIVRSAGPDQKLNTSDDKVVTQLAGNDQVLGTEDDVTITQYAGPDKVAGTADDQIVTRVVGPDKVAGTADDLPSMVIPPVAPGMKSRPKTSLRKPKITHLGPKDAPTGIVMNFVGEDAKEGTSDDVYVTQTAGPDGQLNTGDDHITSVLAGDDLKPGTEDDLIVIQQVGPDKIAGTEDDSVTTMMIGPDQIAGTEDDAPVTTPLSTALGSALAPGEKPSASARKAAPRTYQKPKVTHLGLGTANEVMVMNFAGEDGKEGTADDYAVTRKVRAGKAGGAAKTDAPVISYAGADGQLGTEDDVTVTQQVGSDRIAGTTDDIVLTQLAGPDKIAGTADDVPMTMTPVTMSTKAPMTAATEPAPETAPDSAAGDSTATSATGTAAGGKPAASRPRTGARQPRLRTNRAARVQNLGLKESTQATVMNFAGEDQVAGTKDDVYVASDLGQKTARASGKTGAGSAGTAVPAGPMTEEVIASLNDFAVSQQVGADKTAGTLDDLVVVQFAGPDKVLGTPDDIRATSGSTLAGPDGKPGTADDQQITQHVGPDKVAGTADDIVVTRSAGKDKKLGTADDVTVSAPVSGGTTAAVAEGTAPATPGEATGETAPPAAEAPAEPIAGGKSAVKASPSPKAESKPVASLFPKPAVSRTARPELKHITTQVKADSPAKVKKVTFERTAKTIQWQLEKMDYCEAYLCDDRYQSERVIENIETLIDEFPDAQFTRTQLDMLNTALIKAIEYKKNWKKYTPDYEIGLMSQEQVDDAINPLISRLRNVIAVVKKRQQ